MKILWFTNTPSLYDQGKHQYHGGGWIESLESLLRDQKEVDLGVSFFHPTDNKKIVKNQTTYFPLLRKSAKKNPFKAIFNNWFGDLKNENFDSLFLEVIQEFKPDVIQVFGTEGPFSKIQNLTSIPVVIHIQGIINPCLNAFFPINQSKWSFLFNKNYFFNNLIGSSPIFGQKRFIAQAKRERQFLCEAQFIMGRTNWDKMLAKLFNPNVNYFHVDEVLRPIFYKENKAVGNHSNQKFKIISTLSPAVYKGIDVVLKAAKQLKELADFDFQWEIIGLDANAVLLKHFEKTEKINHKEVGIICSGRKNPEEMVALMNAADAFVHPSYIDNSPNSVCEAQILGLPIIACDVGGVSSLVQHGQTGFLVPSNGVFELVHYLIKLQQEEVLRKKITDEGILVASKRHNRDSIVSDLLTAYSEIRSKK